MAFNKNKKIVTTALTAAMVASAVAPVAAAKLTPAQDATKAVDGYYKLSVKTRADVSNSAKVKKAALAKVAKLTSKKDAKLKASLTAKVAKKSAAINKYYQTVIVPTEKEAAAIKAVEAALKIASETPITAETTKEQVEAAYAAVIKLIDAVKTPAKKTEFKAAADKMKEVALAKIEELATPKVAGVTAINLKQIEVKFNKTLDSTDATTAANYLYDGVAVVGTPVLKEDNKTVVITLATAATVKTAHTLKVQNVKTADAKATITSDVFSFFTNDTVNAEVKSTTVLANGNVELAFSEPLQTAPTVVRVNGIPVTIGAFVAGDSKITIPASQIASVAEGASATLYVAGATDFAGLESKTFEGSFVKVVDKTKPAVSSVKQVANQTFQVAFTEDLGADQLAAADITLIDKNGVTLTAGTQYTVTPAVIDGATSAKVFDVVVSSDLFASSTLDSHALTLVVKGNSVNDVAGNVNDAYSTSVSLVRDKVAPTFVSSAVASNKETIEVKFDKAVTPTAGAKAKVIVTDKDGVRYNVDSITQKGATGDNAKVLVVDIIAPAAASQVMANGEYTLQFQAGVATDGLNNTSVAFTTKAVVGNSADSTKPVTALDAASTSNSYVVNFGEEVTNTALSLANYTLDNKALPTGTAIYFTSAAKNQVKIELPEDSINIGTVGTGTNAVLSVSNVKDLAGNTADTKNLAVKVQDNTATVLTGAQLIGNNILKLTFSESIKTPLVVADVLAGLEIKSSVGTVTAAGTTTATASGKDIIITFDAADNFDEVIAAATTVKTLDGATVNGKVEGILDANGLGAKANVSLAATR